MESVWRRQLADGLPVLGVELTAAQTDLLVRYLALLHKWNRAFNLSAVRSPEEMVGRHLLDSLSVLPYVRGTRVIDVGSGAGLPGVPLAVARPDLSVELLDANGKKTRFLNQARLDLGLANVTVVNARVEGYVPPRLFDTVVSRAFASLGEFWRTAAHLLAPHGIMLAMKGRLAPAELADPGLAPGIHREVVDLSAVFGAGRHLVILRRDDG